MSGIIGLLIRHPETHENARGIIMGQRLSGVVNAIGEKQPALTAQHISSTIGGKDSLSPLAIMSSDAGRAIHLTERIAEKFPKTPVTYCAHLRERNMGEFEGRHRNEWVLVQKTSSVEYEHVRPFGGETKLELQKRVMEFLTRIWKQAARQPGTIGIITHGTTIAMMLLSITGHAITERTYREYRPDNCAIATIFFPHPEQKNGNNSIRLLSYNVSDHLPDELRTNRQQKSTNIITSEK